MKNESQKQHINSPDSQAQSREHLHRDLDGKWIAYDIDGRPLGEVVYKKGVMVRRKTYRGKNGGENKWKMSGQV